MPRSTFDLFLTNTPSFSLFAVVARDVVLLVAQSTPRGAFSEVLHQYSRMRSSASTCRWYDARDVWSSRDDSASNCLTRE